MTSVGSISTDVRFPERQIQFVDGAGEHTRIVSEDPMHRLMLGSDHAAKLEMDGCVAILRTACAVESACRGRMSCCAMRASNTGRIDAPGLLFVGWDTWSRAGYEYVRPRLHRMSW